MTPAPPATIVGSQNKPLKEVAKHFAAPFGEVVGSFWPTVRETCTQRMGLEFDRWQDGMAGLMLAYDSNGDLVHTVGGFACSICRQTGKTHTVASVVFGACVEYPGLLCIWTAHHSTTSDETFEAMQGFAARLKVKPFIEQIFKGSGDEEIRFWNGSRIMFGARERGFGRGMPGVDVIVNDEAQILSQRAMQNMLATMNTSKLGLHVYAGTPPKPEDNSEMWLGIRADALAAEKLGTDLEDTVWIEFGAPDDADPDNESVYPIMNPSYPHRTPLKSIKRLRKRLDADGFRREAMGLYDDDDEKAFNMKRWMALIDMDVEAPGEVALLVDVSPDRKWATIGVAGDGGVTADGQDRSMVMVESLKGTTQVVERLLELREQKHIVDVSLFSGGAARLLKPDLTRAGIEFEELTANDMAAAYGALQEAIKNQLVVHVDQPELNYALANAQSRFLNTGEAEAFDRRGQHVNVSPAVAAAGALYRWNLLYAPMPVIL
jgi:hypothetical protein